MLFGPELMVAARAHGQSRAPSFRPALFARDRYV
jgi:hypothetical protein